MESRVENGIKQELGAYNHSERGLPLPLAERAKGRDGPHVSTDLKSTPWGKRKASDIIVID